MNRQRCASGWTKDSDNAPNQSSVSSGNAGEAVSDRNKKVGAEHSKDAERGHEELSVARRGEDRMQDVTRMIRRHNEGEKQ